MRSLYDMAKGKRAKFFVCVSLVIALVVWMYWWDRADASIVTGGDNGYHWTAKKAHRQLENGELKSLSAILKNGKKIHGHAICKPGYYPTVSKYLGMTCASHKTDKKASHWMISCAGDTFIGFVFGRLAGAGAGISACVFHGLIG